MQAVNRDLDTDEVWQARVDLAACFRAAAKLGMNEGVCNHLSAVVPGHDDLFLVNPDGWGFAEITASRLLICDYEGNVVTGDGAPEDTAFFIHARVHLRVPRAKAAFHTHMPNATALAMLEGPPFSWALQTSLRFHNRLGIDAHYNGVALDTTEGDRIAASIGTADIVFMKNHGVMVVAPTIAKAWDDLFYLERAAEAEVLALSTGRKLAALPQAMIDQTLEQIRRNAGNRGSARMHLDSVKRQLDRTEPEYPELTRALLLALVLLAGGCTIIDQRTFRSAAHAPGQVEQREATLPPLPLITVRFDAPLDNDAIIGAVELAMARKPGVVFDVIAPIPTAAARPAQEEALLQGRADTEQVATAIAAAGAARDHIQLGLRADPGVPGREVRVYVR